MIFDGYGNKILDGSSIFSAEKIKASQQAFFTGTDSSAYGTLGQVIECAEGEKFYWNGAFATNGTYQSPVMLSALPNADSIYDTSVVFGEAVSPDDDGGYTAAADGAIFFPIEFTKGATAETRTFGNIIIQTAPVDPYYARNYPENYRVNSAPSPLTLCGILENYIPMIGAKAVILGDSISEQSAGYKAGADAYGFYEGQYDSDGWFSRIARKYGMEYRVHGYGQQWWYVTDDRPNGGVKAVNSLIESGYLPDYIVLEYGTNDIWTGTLGDTADTADEAAASTVGALRYCIETLQANFPSSKIIVIMPCMRNSMTAKQDTYYDLVAPILGEYGIPYVDMAHCSGIVISMMRSDGVHLATQNEDNTYNNDTEAVKRYSRCLEGEMLLL